MLGAVEHEAVDGAGKGAGAAADHLGEESSAGGGAGNGDTLDAGLIEAFGEDADVHEKLEPTILVVAKDLAPFVLWRVHGDAACRLGRVAIEHFGHSLGDLEVLALHAPGRGKDDGAPSLGQFDDGGGHLVDDALATLHAGDVGLVEVAGGDANPRVVQRGDGH